MQLARSLLYTHCNRVEQKKMMRITEQSEDPNTMRIRLDGKLDLESYAELEAIWSRASENKNTRLVIDMTGVVFMSDDAARRLTSQRSDSFHIVNCSPFIEMLLGNISNQKGN